jgi:hypothetical protein
VEWSKFPGERVVVSLKQLKKHSMVCWVVLSIAYAVEDEELYDGVQNYVRVYPIADGSEQVVVSLPGLDEYCDIHCIYIHPRYFLRK